jgi:hypothetical protein
MLTRKENRAVRKLAAAVLPNPDGAASRKRDVDQQILMRDSAIH